MKILLTKKFLTEDYEYIKKRCPSGIQFIKPETYDVMGIMKVASSATGFLGDFFTKEILDIAIKLEFIQVPWTGVDRIKFSLLKGRQIRIFNSHSNAIGVAELAVSLMLDVQKQISYHDNKLRKLDWCRPGDSHKSKFRPPFLIKGQKIIIYGGGKIGSRICKLCKAFSANITVVGGAKYKRYYSKCKINFIDKNETPKDICEYDVVFLSLPLTSKTIGIIDRKFLAKMSKDAILINVGRGAIVNELDLYNCLLTGKLRGAGIDVWEKPFVSGSKRYPSKFPFHELNNVTLSPHRGGFIKGRKPHLRDVIINLNRAYRGLKMINEVKFDNEY